MLFPQTKVKIYVVHKISDLKEPEGLHLYKIKIECLFHKDNSYQIQ